MAENAGGGWWSGLIQAAKDKSTSAIEFVKKDLSEFTNTMQHDTNVAASEVKSKLTHENAVVATQKAKAGVSQLFGGLTKVLTVEAEDLRKPPRKSYTQHSKHIFDRAQARLNAIQVDPETYCEDPSGSKEEYTEWVQTFNIDQKKGDISELLVVNVEVRALYTQLVPSQVSHADFWQRYFYKLYQLSLDEKRKADLMKRADDVQEECGWDDDDDWGDLEGSTSPPNGTKAGSPKRTKEDKDQDDKCSITSSDASDLDTNKRSEDGDLVTNKTVSDPNTNASSEVVGKEHGADVDLNVNIDAVKESSVKKTDIEIITVSPDKVELEENLSIKTNVPQPEVKLSQSPTEDVSLSVSSITTDSSAPIVMESSTDTLTLVSPLGEDVTADAVLSKNVSGVVEQQSITSTEEDTSESVSGSSMSNIQPTECAVSETNVSVDVVVEEEKELKTRIKGDLVVVGSGASSASDGTTPSSTSSSNKEVEDEWEKEFEVTEDDLVQHSNAAATTVGSVTNDTCLADEADDDWENWE